MDHTNEEELTRLSNLIDLIYDGATDSSRWTKDILPAIADYIEAPTCILFSPIHTPQNGGFFFLYGLEQEHIDLYASKYQSQDSWTLAGTEKNLFHEGNVLIGEDLVPREQLLETTFYKEFLSRDKNTGQLLTSIVYGLDSSAAMPAVCTSHRGLHHPNFGEKERARMRLLLPHLSRSLGVMQRLRSAELTVATSLAALDRLPSGVLLLNDSGAVAFANRAAQHMLGQGDGLSLRKASHATGHGELIAESSSVNMAISKAIDATLTRDPYDTPHFSKYVTVPRTSRLASYTLQFSALGNHSEFGGGSDAFAAIVFIADGAQKIDIDPIALQSAYGLTPAEARVAIALVEFSSAKEVADVLGVSPLTVRAQTNAIYAKLGVNTRTRFVKTMLGLASHRH
jgi:DNA-binding CsgD family transcriptional regulator